MPQIKDILRPLFAILFCCPLLAEQKLSLTQSEESLKILADENPILVYNLSTVEPPPGIDPIYRRSGFIHPVYAPNGKIVTQSFSPHHPHQNGIFMAWTQTRYRDEFVDFWNVHKGLGKVSHNKLLSTETSDDRITFKAEIHHDALTGESPQTVLKEILEIAVLPPKDGIFIFDITSQQTACTSEPLILSEYRYGGMAVRLTDLWYGENSDQVSFSTNEGLDRASANQTRASWVAASGQIEGKPTTIAVLCHPDNFRAPQPVRIHHKLPYFSYSPMALGEFSIEPSVVYTSQYRYLVASKFLEAETIEAAWQRYAQQ